MMGISNNSTLPESVVNAVLPVTPGHVMTTGKRGTFVCLNAFHQPGVARAESGHRN